MPCSSQRSLLSIALSSFLVVVFLFSFCACGSLKMHVPIHPKKNKQHNSQNPTLLESGPVSSWPVPVSPPKRHREWLLEYWPQLEQTWKRSCASYFGWCASSGPDFWCSNDGFKKSHWLQHALMNLQRKSHEEITSRWKALWFVRRNHF